MVSVKKCSTAIVPMKKYCLKMQTRKVSSLICLLLSSSKTAILLLGILDRPKSKGMHLGNFPNYFSRKYTKITMYKMTGMTSKECLQNVDYMWKSPLSAFPLAWVNPPRATFQTQKIHHIQRLLQTVQTLYSLIADTFTLWLPPPLRRKWFCSP